MKFRLINGLLLFNYWWIQNNRIQIWILRRIHLKQKPIIVLYEIHEIVINYNLYTMNIQIYFIFKIHLKTLKKYKI